MLHYRYSDIAHTPEFRYYLTLYLLDFISLIFISQSERHQNYPVVLVSVAHSIRLSQLSLPVRSNNYSNLFVGGPQYLTPSSAIRRLGFFDMLY